MPKNNALNVSLDGQTGTIQNVMSDSPSMTGNVDFSSGSMEIPNSTTPSLSSVGQIALDTSIPNFNPLIKYHDGVEEFSAIGLPVADFGTNDGDILCYSTPFQKFILAPPTSSGGKIVQKKVGTFSGSFVTTSLSAVATGLSVDITPTSSLNTILIEAYGYIRAAKTGPGNLPERYGATTLQRTTPSSTALGLFNFGRVTESSSSNAQSVSPLYLMYAQTAISVALHTYEIYLSSSNTSVEAALLAFSGDALIFAYELEV